MAKKNSPLLNPLPQADEGTNVKGDHLILVAYHAGPEEIGFFGKVWQRDSAQSVTADEWAAMRLRGDFDEFNFIEEK
ncbi:MAG: hypothetical protein B7Y56_03420 [Gallionellales bacterium 35-53-114]|jgi:hypothetical protein|nr:MAG: hypothetical protein B7Y56_03420 [Gallionellales bacterium 35-53-114]OYZ65155.1 MAG: hypothetical protein B7Y04_00580 [Gallionellales bacterium 24-53-125]OZB08063.1 MAG: hypothetical protein B7X61_11030 [Gallionellales bacterium 39-52-133]HQS59967.1 hypothetical protein [Gallionellaceae bacterium]HQS76651.1 hypothetical protein [Gallionellaceae bacterium]